MSNEIQLSLFAAESGSRVLVVDDDAATRESLVRLLQEAGLEVLSAGTAAEALIELGEMPMLALDLLITDVELPGMLGTGLARELWKRRPGLPVLFISGDPTYAALGRDPSGGAAFLEKPFSSEQLLTRVALLLKESRLAEMVG